MKFFVVVAILLSLAYGTSGQEPSRATTVPPITERRIVGEEWNMLSECRTSLENYMCASQRTSVSVAIALNTGICAATVGYVNCLETTCPSSPALRESITRIRDRCQGSTVKSTTTTTQVPTSTTRATPTPTTGVPTSTTRATPTPTTGVPTSTTRATPTPSTGVPTSTTRETPTPATGVPTSTIRATPTPTTDVPTSTTRATPTPTTGVPTSTTRATPTPSTDFPTSTTRVNPTPTTGVPTSTTRANPTPTTDVPTSTTRATPTPSTGVPTSTTRATPAHTTGVPTSTTRATPTPSTGVPTSTTRATPTTTTDVPTSTTRATPTPSTGVPTSTTRATPAPSTGVPASTTRATPTPSTGVPTSTTRATPTTTTGVPTSSTRASPTPSTDAPTSTTRVYIKSLISEIDLVDNEWSTLTTCRFMGADDVCNIAKKTLQSSLIIESGVCGAALSYINCLETNCHSSSDLDASIQRVRNRCNGQATGGQVTNTDAPHTAAPTPPPTPPPTPRPTLPTTQKTSTQIPETDVVVAEWNTLTACHLVDDEEEETCDGVKQQLQHALVAEYGVCVSAIDYVECLENVCLQTYSLTNSINRIRSRCNGDSSNGQGATSSPGTQVSESDLVSKEWYALSTCSFIDEEEEEGCDDAKTELQEAMRYDSGVCVAAIIYVDCLQDTCRPTHTLTDSITRVRTGCNGASQPDTGTPGAIVSDEDFVSKEWHTLSTCVLLDPEEEDCGETKEELQEALRTGSEVCAAASGYVECLEEACLITHTLTESLNKIKTRCAGEGEDPEEILYPNLPGTLGSESTVVNSEMHILTTCALQDPEEEDCGEPKTDLQDALRSNEDICGAALEYVECLEEACLVTHSLADSFIRIKNRCGGEEEEDD